MTEQKRVLRAPEAAAYTGLSESTLAERRLGCCDVDSRRQDDGSCIRGYHFQDSGCLRETSHEVGCGDEDVFKRNVVPRPPR
jgi:hypothetical protein